MDIDECASDPAPCDTNATCTNTDGAYRCACADGFVGEGLPGDCAPIPGCEGQACVNGQCIETDGVGTCICDPGFEGDACEINIDDCPAEVCNGHGACLDGDDGLSCLCDEGFSGHACEIDIDDCRAEVCNGHGACLDGDDGLSCLCDEGFSGHACDLRLLHPIAYWPFDEESPDESTRDRAGGGNTLYACDDTYATGDSPPRWVSACPGSASPCYHFDCESQPSILSAPRLEAVFNDAERFTAHSDFTLAIRLRRQDSNSPSELIHAPRSATDHYPFRLYWNHDRINLCTYLGESPRCVSIDYSEHHDRWTQIIAWKLGEALCLSLDGGTPNCASFPVLASPEAPAPGRLMVGRNPNGANPLKGYIDDLMIFAHALSDDEHAHLAAGMAIVDSCEPGDADCCGNGVCDGVETLETCVADCSNSLWEKRFLREYFHRQNWYTVGTVGTVKPGYVYWANLRIRPFMDMYEATGKDFYFRAAVEAAKAVIRLQEDLNGDGHLEWPCNGNIYGCLGDPVNAKQALSAERAARALTGLARMIRTRPELNANEVDSTWADNVARNIVSTLLLNPLYSDRYDDTHYTSADSNPLPNAPVHHIVAHAATVMFNLNQVLNGGATHGTYYDGFMLRARHLRDSLLSNPGGAGVAWGSIWCQQLVRDPLCYVGWDQVITVYCAEPTPPGSPTHTYCYPMDSAHSTDFVDTAVQLRDAGYVFTDTDIDDLRHTLKDVMMRGTPDGTHYFSTHIDGTEQPPVDPNVTYDECTHQIDIWYHDDPHHTAPPPCATGSALSAAWTRGHLAPGWTSLARDDTSLKQILATMADNRGEYRLPRSLMLRYCAQMALLDAPNP